MKAEQDELSLYVAAATRLHGLNLDDARRAEVERQFYLLKSMAQQFLEFPLSADIEPAASFRP